MKTIFFLNPVSHYGEINNKKNFLPGVGGFGLGLLPPPQPKTKTTKKIKKMFKIFVINLRQRKVVH